MGNSAPERVCGASGTVHPHVHGELTFPQEFLYFSLGSSPRAWGTPGPLTVPVIVERFIPTCMGNSHAGDVTLQGEPVHTHVHGELRTLIPEEDWSTGSSPRAWGTHDGLRICRRMYRFIPTCMGNSKVVKVEGGYMAVHPHVHGELNLALKQTVSRVGSSPRAWGTQNL